MIFCGILGIDDRIVVVIKGGVIIMYSLVLSNYVYCFLLVFDLLNLNCKVWVCGVCLMYEKCVKCLGMC